MSAMLSESGHTSRPWRIHEVAHDFRVEDVWALPTPDGPGGFPRLVELVAGFEPQQSSSRALRSLFAIRWRIGNMLGWDAAAAGIGSRVPTLRDRLPDELRAAPAGPTGKLPFTPVYLTEDEWALELANETVHGVLHLAWVADADGSYRGQMAILVKRNGLLGGAYMAAIAPFRHLIVYPALMRDIERGWGEAGDPEPGARVAA